MEKWRSKQGKDPIRQLLKYRKCEANVLYLRQLLLPLHSVFKVKD